MRIKAMASLCIMITSALLYAEIADWDLLEGSKTGDMGKVTAALEKGANINAVDHNGNTPLMLASQNGRTEIVRLLAGKGAAVNAANSAGFTAIILGAAACHPDITRLLVVGGADVNARVKGGFTALMYTACSSHRRCSDVAKILLDNGADAGIRTDNGELALHLAGQALFGTIPPDVPFRDKVLWMLDATKVKIEKHDWRITNLLFWAVDSGHDEILFKLLDKGADVNARFTSGPEFYSGWTMLHHTAYSGSLKKTRMLIQRGARVNATNNEKETPLHWASARGNLDVARALIVAGADVNVKCAKGDTPLIMASSQGKTETVKLLIQSGAQVNARARDGYTALMGALQHRHDAIAGLLRSAGARDYTRIYRKIIEK
ncbi:MAG: ankyrin repeat domain-containing protein [Spirochaetes bacterium]|nr:ankyrin repeat domain-containing protein [Spirochaetota bacterium]